MTNINATTIAQILVNRIKPPWGFDFDNLKVQSLTFLKYSYVFPEMQKKYNVFFVLYQRFFSPGGCRVRFFAVYLKGYE